MIRSYQKLVFCSFFKAPCYGFYFLSAIEAFDAESSKPDVMVLDNAMMDMENMRLYKKLTDIINRCDSDPSSKLCSALYIRKL